jgi:putative Holliday junction resolvase
MILGVDPGERRTGLAIADLTTRFARPLEVIDARTIDPVARIVEVCRDMEVDVVVVGRPVALSGASGPAVESQQVLVTRLRDEGLNVEEYDERLTTVVAERALRTAGTKARQRKAVRDAVAAQVMLQDYMDSRR